MSRSPPLSEPLLPLWGLVLKMVQELAPQGPPQDPAALNHPFRGARMWGHGFQEAAGREQCVGANRKGGAGELSWARGQCGRTAGVRRLWTAVVAAPGWPSGGPGNPQSPPVLSRHTVWVFRRRACCLGQLRKDTSPPQDLFLYKPLLCLNLAPVSVWGVLCFWRFLKQESRKRAEGRRGRNAAEGTECGLVAWAGSFSGSGTQGSPRALTAEPFHMFPTRVSLLG